MSEQAGEAIAQGAQPVLHDAVAVIFVTILLDMPALGVIASQPVRAVSSRAQA
ncbi:hypothetical protein ACVWZ4_006483 [Bradyrhizobium sp. USDA 4472]